MGVGSIDINKVIEKQQKTEEYQYMKYGEDYYKSRNTYIMEREKKVCLDGFGIRENIFQANYKIPSGYFKKIVDQKVQYLLGNGIRFEEDQTIDEYFESGFDDIMVDLATSASKKRVAWLMAYKANNRLMFTEVAPEQCYPVFDEYGQLKMMIREYEENGTAVRLVYDDETVSRYEYQKREYALVKTTGHYTQSYYVNEKKVSEEPLGFGVVPFIPLWNNREKLSDLVPIKAHIDMYDVVMSDFANNIDDMQDAYFTLKGYSGDTKDIIEFMRQLKQVKAVPVSEDGALDAHQLQIPTEARKTALALLENDIYESSMGVNIKNLSGGSITNVYIKAMFTDLDLKADQFEWQIRKFVIKLIEFINEKDKKNLSAAVYMDRSLIMNNTEMVENILKASMYYSDETTRELLPYEVDEEREKKRIEEERGETRLTNDLVDEE